MQFTLNQEYSTPRQHPILTPKQEIANNYNQLMVQYSELEQEMYSQKADNQVKYQQILNKIDNIYNELTSNINQLTSSSKSEYSQLLSELKSQKEHNIQMIQTILSTKQQQITPQYSTLSYAKQSPIKDDYFDYIESQEQQLMDELQTLDSYKCQRFENHQEHYFHGKEVAQSPKLNLYSYQSPGSNRPMNSYQNSNQQYKQVMHTPLISTQFSSTNQHPDIRQQRQCYGTNYEVSQEQNYRIDRRSYGSSINQPAQTSQISPLYQHNARQYSSPIHVQDEEIIVKQRDYSPINVGRGPTIEVTEIQPRKHNYFPTEQQQISYNQQQLQHLHKPIFEQQLPQKQSISQIEYHESQAQWSQINEPPFSNYKDQHQEQEQFKKELEQLRKQDLQKEKILLPQQQRQFSQQSLPPPPPQQIQNPTIMHQKEKIFDVSQLNCSREKTLSQFHQQVNTSIQHQQHQEILNVSHNQLNHRNVQVQHENKVPVNDQVVPLSTNNEMILNESEQSYIMDLYGNLGYDQFYQYLRQSYPIVLEKVNRPNHGDQRILKQDQEAQDLMHYIYCTLCDQFISIKQANNHTAFCLTNTQKSKYKHDDAYLDLFICCTDPKNQFIETKEQKLIRLCNELTKIRYLVQTALKQKEYTQEQQKQKEYCLFALEILTLIIQNPRNTSITQQAQDLISIYQVLDQQQYNFYKQIVFLLQKANQRIQQLIQ